MGGLFNYLQIDFVSGDLVRQSVRPEYEQSFIALALLCTLPILLAAVRLLRQNGLNHTQRTLLAGICMGGGVWLTHATGAAAMQLPASATFQSGLALDALVISICGSLLALATLGNLRATVSPVRLVCAGTVLGATFTLTHHATLISLVGAGQMMFVPDLWIYAQLIAISAAAIGLAALTYHNNPSNIAANVINGVLPALLLLGALTVQHFISIGAMYLTTPLPLDTLFIRNNPDVVHTLAAGVLLTSGLTILIGWQLQHRSSGAPLIDSKGYRIEHMMESVPDSVLVVARSGAVQQMNRSAMDLFDVDPDAVQVLNARALIPQVAECLDGNIETGGSQRYMEFDGCTVGGREVPLEVSVSELQASEGDFFVLVARDISVRKRVEQHIRNLLEENKRLATTDTLTGLPNRRHILDTVGKEISRCARHGHSLSVLMIDIDYFKRINDTHGHAAGDQALREMASVVRSVARSSDLVSRFGGEEFLLVLTETGMVQARLVADRLREQVGLTPVMTDRGDCFSMTISVGVSQWDTGMLFEDVVAQADRALYNAKATGRNRVVVYTEGLPAVPAAVDSA